jgi:hypothetical protein
MRNRVQVEEFTTPYTHKNVGKEFYIHFNSYDKDPGQYTIEPDTDDPLKGTTGTTMQYTAETVVAYNKNLLFMPIPFEMLNTYETSPQMLVTVDTMPAVCHGMNCGYNTTAAVGSVTTFTYDDSNNRTLTITGTNLPTNSSLIQSVSFAGSNCTLINVGTNGTLSGT